MIRPSFAFVAFALSLATGFCGAGVFAQSGDKQPLRFEQNVKPAFRVNPIVHRFDARRGATIPFEFELESARRATSVRIRTVSLSQDVNGTIIPDTKTPPPDAVTLLSPAAIDLADDETTVIRGRIKVPFSNSKYHSFGILVTDLGRIVGSQTVRTSNDEERRVGVRFITRYLLRCDIVIQGARGGDMTKVVMESCELFEEDGNAHARVLLRNPTDSPFEFQARARLARPDHGSRQRAFYLAMPVRHNYDPPDRFTVRLLPNARIQVIERLPEAVFPGEQEMQVELITKGRSRVKRTFPITIQQGDFPGQDATIVQVARDITVTPSQVELSMRRGGKRYVPLELSNSSKQKVDITLTGRTPAGRSLDWLVVRPASITLNPGAKRKILVTTAPGGTLESHKYGSIRVNATAEEGKAIGQFDVTVCLIARSEQQPQVELEELQWDGQSSPPAFFVEAGNTGAMHLPLNATLTILNAFGRPVELQSGYGTWLLPGHSTELRFPVSFVPPASDYQYKLELRAEDGELLGEASEGVVVIP